MNVQPIVEGYGEVEAVPVLLRRLRDEASAFVVEVGRPIRRTRSELVQEAAVRRAVKLALMQPDCGAILIIFDSDDDCPKELAPLIEGWARAESGDVPCAVVMAHREYEAWFLGALASLRGRRGIRQDAHDHPEPERPRSAKGALEDNMLPGRTYSETADQAPLTAAFDMARAFGRCRSFRRMVCAFGAVLVEAGICLGAWPPSAWGHRPPYPSS